MYLCLSDTNGPSLCGNFPNKRGRLPCPHLRPFKLELDLFHRFRQFPVDEIQRPPAEARIGKLLLDAIDCRVRDRESGGLGGPTRDHSWLIC